MRIFSADLIPWPLAAVAHVDAVEQESEHSGVEPEFSIPDIR
jgi:hypothetical protein